MCNATSQQMDMFKKTIEQFLAEGRMFTAYDVTVTTRKRENIKLFHRDVRGAAHEVDVLRDACDFGYKDGNGNTVEWHKATVENPANKQDVFVYHPDGVDPKTYDFSPSSQSAPAPAAATPVASTTPTSNGSTNGSANDFVSDGGGLNADGSFSADSRGRLFIQKRFVQPLGLGGGSTIYVLVDSTNSRLVLSSAALTDSKSHTVERNGDLRLSSAVLRDSGLNPNEDFVIENSDQNGDQVIEISQK